MSSKNGIRHDVSENRDNQTIDWHVVWFCYSVNAIEKAENKEVRKWQYDENKTITMGQTRQASVAAHPTDASQRDAPTRTL